MNFNQIKKKKKKRRNEEENPFSLNQFPVVLKLKLHRNGMNVATLAAAAAAAAVIIKRYEERINNRC